MISTTPEPRRRHPDSMPTRAVVRIQLRRIVPLDATILEELETARGISPALPPRPPLRGLGSDRGRGLARRTRAQRESRRPVKARHLLTGGHVGPLLEFVTAPFDIGARFKGPVITAITLSTDDDQHAQLLSLAIVDTCFRNT